MFSSLNTLLIFSSRFVSRHCNNWDNRAGKFLGKKFGTEKDCRISKIFRAGVMARKWNFSRRGRVKKFLEMKGWNPYRNGVPRELLLEEASRVQETIKKTFWKYEDDRSHTWERKENKNIERFSNWNTPNTQLTGRWSCERRHFFDGDVKIQRRDNVGREDIQGKDKSRLIVPGQTNKLFGV